MIPQIIVYTYGIAFVGLMVYGLVKFLRKTKRMQPEEAHQFGFGGN